DGRVDSAGSQTGAAVRRIPAGRVRDAGPVRRRPRRPGVRRNGAGDRDQARARGTGRIRQVGGRGQGARRQAGGVELEIKVRCPWRSSTEGIVSKAYVSGKTVRSEVVVRNRKTKSEDEIGRRNRKTKSNYRKAAEATVADMRNRLLDGLRQRPAATLRLLPVVRACTAKVLATCLQLADLR